MSYEYNNQGASNRQSSLSRETITEEKDKNEQKKKLILKYRNTSFALIGIIVVAVAALLMIQLDFGRSKQEEYHNLQENINVSEKESEAGTTVKESEAGTTVKESETSTTVKESETSAIVKEEIAPKEYEWSEWLYVLPEYVTDKHYSIEEQILCRSRELNVRISSENNPEEGWVLINTEQVNPRYTEWSEWSADKPEASVNRSVEESVRYRSREKEWCTTTNAQPNGNGWVLESSTTSWTDWSDWGEWTTDILEGSESCEVETYNVARYTCSCNSSFENFTVAMVAHAAQMHGITDEAEADLFALMRGNYTGSLDSSQILGNAGFWFENQVMYRCRTRDLIVTNHFYRWSNWSDWSESAVAENDVTEVEFAIFYRYRDCNYDTTYYFGCWGDWSEYTTDVKTANDTRQVETITQYRYKPIK